MTVIQMSVAELSRLRMMIELADGRLTVAAAGTLMGVGPRQVFRLRRAFAADDASGWFRASVVARAIAGVARRSTARCWL